MASSRQMALDLAPKGHGEDTVGAAQRRALVDPYATGLLFDGWRDAPARFVIPDGYEPLPVSGPRTWRLTTGWRIHPLIGLREVPGPRPRREVPSPRSHGGRG